MNLIARPAHWLRTELRPAPALRCLLVFLPYGLLYACTGWREALTLALLGGGLFIATDGLGLGPRMMLLHFSLGLTLFLVLYAGIGSHALFALLCGAAALGVIALSGVAVKLRSFGNWIFIPSVYLACELGAQKDWDARMAALPGIFFLAAFAPLVVFAVEKLSHAPLALERARNFSELATGLGEGNSHWTNQALAAFASVLVATSLVGSQQIEHGQWVIWSALSVIAMDTHQARTKIRNRIFGVLVGCPLGLLLGAVVPRFAWLYPVACAAILLTLVSFQSYRLAFTIRCALTAFAAMVAGGSYEVADERVTNVVLGGFIGVIAVHVAEACPRFRNRE